MSTIFIPYSLGDMRVLGFKEIDVNLFNQLKTALSEIINLENQPQIRIEDHAHEISAAWTLVFKDINEKTALYNKAAREYEEFKERHHKIFARGEELKDSENTMLSDIFISRYKRCQQHYKRYKYVYDKLENLRSAMCEYRLYSPESRNSMIERSKEDCVESVMRKYKKVEEERRKRLSELGSWMYKFRSYTMLIRDLRIDVDGAVTNISGKKDDLQFPKGFEAFKYTFINKAITLTR